MNEEELKYQIAITLLNGIGAIGAKKLIAYFVITLLLYAINTGVHQISTNAPFNYLFASVLLVAFILFVARIEKKELKSIFNSKSN